MTTFLSLVSISALLIFPVSILVLDGVGGLMFLLVTMAGFYSLFMRHRKGVGFSREEKIFFVSVSMLFITALLTSFVTDTDLARGDRFLGFVLIIPVYLLYRNVALNPAYSWFGLVAGAVVSVSVGGYQVYGPDALPRAVGVVHPIIFGDLSMMMGLLSGAGIIWFFSRKKWLSAFSIIGICAGVLASILSMSRGGWVALPAVAIVFAIYYSKYFSVKKIILILCLFTFTVGSIYFIPQSGVKQRLDSTAENIQRYMDSQNPNDRARSTSIGLRFEMWRSAMNMFRENPVFGGGWGEFRKYTAALISDGLINKNAGRFYHAHNEYLSILAKGGLVSFTAFLMILLVPAILFYRKIKTLNSGAEQSYALGGVALIVGFACFGLSEAIFERSRPVIFFSFYLAVMMAGVLNPHDGSTQQEPKSANT